MNLELNYSKMGLTSRGSNVQWYTARINDLALIHIHNYNKDDKWTYIIVTGTNRIKVNGFDSKDLAFETVRSRLYRIIADGLEQVIS